MPEQPGTFHTEPDIVYHYTSLAAMRSILRTRKLWASNVAYLNDTQERLLFLKLVDDNLHNLDLDYGWQAIPYFAEDKESAKISNSPFVVSFSAEADALNQWRSYCPSANGVSIGFRTAALREATLEWRPAYEGHKRGTFSFIPSCKCRAVEYIGIDATDQVYERMKWVIADTKRWLSTMDPEEGPPSLEVAFRQGIEAEASFYKHTGFRSEQEYRLLLPDVTWQSHLVEFRSTRSSMVPYVELSIPSSPDAPLTPAGIAWDAMVEMIVGPTPNSALTVSAVQAFCRSIRLDGVIVKASQIPYRDW